MCGYVGANVGEWGDRVVADNGSIAIVAFGVCDVIGWNLRFDIARRRYDLFWVAFDG